MVVDSKYVFTGAGDNTAKLWDCERGKEIRNFNTNSSVRSCGFSHLGDLIMFTTDERTSVNCEILVYDVRTDESAVARIPVDGSKVTTALWGPFDEFIVTGHEDGSLSHYDHRVSTQ